MFYILKENKTAIQALWLHRINDISRVESRILHFFANHNMYIHWLNVQTKHFSTILITYIHVYQISKGFHTCIYEFWSCWSITKGISKTTPKSTSEAFLLSNVHPNSKVQYFGRNDIKYLHTASSVSIRQFEWAFSQ